MLACLQSSPEKLKRKSVKIGKTNTHWSVKFLGIEPTFSQMFTANQCFMDGANRPGWTPRNLKVLVYSLFLFC